MTYFDSFGREIPDDELGEPITEAQLIQRFDQVVAACRDIATGFAAPVKGEPLPLLNTRNFPIANDALGTLVESGEILEFASIFMLMCADQIRGAANSSYGTVERVER